jgi:preprotein translocase subunit Sss1
MSLALIVSLVVLAVVALVGVLGYLIDRSVSKD